MKIELPAPGGSWAWSVVNNGPQLLLRKNLDQEPGDLQTIFFTYSFLVLVWTAKKRGILPRSREYKPLHHILSLIKSSLSLAAQKKKEPSFRCWVKLNISPPSSPCLSSSGFYVLQPVWGNETTEAQNSQPWILFNLVLGHCSDQTPSLAHLLKHPSIGKGERAFYFPNSNVWT